MTVCVAAICEDGEAIVLVTDKMVGMGYVEAEPDISKMRPLCKNWWVLFSGDDITPVFDVIDHAREQLTLPPLMQALNEALGADVTMQNVMKAVQVGFEKKRIADAEAVYLTPIGWTLEKFNGSDRSILSDAAQIQVNIQNYRLPIDLLVTGFHNEQAYIFQVTGYGEHAGIPQRFDIPGYKRRMQNRPVNAA